MKKVRAIYMPDKIIKTLILPSHMRREGETEEEHLERFHQEMITKGRTDLDAPFDDFDEKDLPRQDGFNRAKWRGEKGKGVWIDDSVVTEAEKRKAVEDELDAELAKPNTDLKKVAKLQRKLDKRDY